jgi:hypothetical protein
MKKSIVFVAMCFFVCSFGAFAQLKVNSLGKVGIGTEADNGYNLCLYKAIIKVPGYSNTIVLGSEINNPRSAIYPIPNNSGTLGIIDRQFLNVYANYHYANTVLLTSDKRLKENFRTIENPLSKLLQISGKKYDFISQGSDTIKNEVEKQKIIKLEKNRLGFIAQDLEKILPEAVFYFKEEDRYYIDYNAIIPVIIEGMKEQQNVILDLKNRIASIEATCCTNNLKSASIPTGDLTNDKAVLNQNVPNPFSSETRIDCIIPEGSENSVLYIYNMNGTQLQQFSIKGIGEQSVSISGNTLEAGMYIYALVIDGREVDTKRMILTK